MAFSFKCGACSETHHGMPSFGAPAPLSYYEVPQDERASRCDLSSDACVIDGKAFFVRGCLDIAVHGQPEPFSWGVWVALDEALFRQWIGLFDQRERAGNKPFPGTLDAWLKPYPDTTKLRTRLHLRDNGSRPYIELAPSEHPLALEQRDGISVERLADIYSLMMHQDE